MIKKSHRKQLDQKSQDVSVDEAHKRFSKAIELINKVHKQIFRIPDGYYICPDCKGKEPVYISKKPKRNVLNDFRGQVFLFKYCNSCKGSGYIDFASNAMKNSDEFKMKVAGYTLPINSAEMNTHELASIIFYLVYEKHNYCGFNVNLNKLGKNNLKYKYAQDFLNYFIKYKKNRNKRKKFIEKHFDNLQTKLKEITKTKESVNKETICQACNNFPFDIWHDQDFDLLKLKICGKCYGYGYQTKRDTQPVIEKYIIDIENPDYSNKNKMLKSLLNTADLGSASLIFELGKIQYKESKLKN